MTNTIFGRGAPDVSFSENLVLEGGLGSLSMIPCGNCSWFFTCNVAILDVL